MRLVSGNASVAKAWLKSNLAFPVLFLVLLCPESLFGQADTGRITGTASDATVAVVPNVKVTIIAVETNRRLTFVTNSTGRYSSGPLQPGEYRLEVEAPVFKRLVREAISLQVQETAVVNLQLEPIERDRCASWNGSLSHRNDSHGGGKL
jgi:hypothetical protein